MNKRIVILSVLIIMLIYSIPIVILNNNSLFLSTNSVSFTIEEATIDSEELPFPSVVTTTESLRSQFDEIRQNSYVLNHYPKEISFDGNYVKQLEYLKELNIIPKQFFLYCTDTELQQKKIVNANRVENSGGMATLQFYNVTIEDDTYTLFQETWKNKFVDISMPLDEMKNEKEYKQLMKNYIKYLGLDYLDDWTYKNGVYYSANGGNVKIQVSQQDNRLRIWMQVHYGYLS